MEPIAQALASILWRALRIASAAIGAGLRRAGNRVQADIAKLPGPLFCELSRTKHQRARPFS